MKDITKFSSAVKIKYYLAIIITFLYVFRGFANKLGLGSIIYFLTIVLFVLSIVSIKNNYVNITILLYIFSGLLATGITFFIAKNNAFLIGIVGFISNYINMFVWLVLFYSLNQTQLEDFIQKYLSIIITFAAISGIIAIYQTFVDASIGGLAISGIYANEELLSSGQYVRRATALFGSAQNYGFYMGVSFCALICSNYKKKCFWFIKAFFILVGIFLSGSRSASSCVVIAVFILLYRSFKTGKFNKNIILLSVGISGLALLFLIASQIVNADTISRLARFGVSAAKEVYQKTLDEMNALSFIFGNGIGYKNWTTRQFVGAEIYEAAYGTNYSSTESFFMQILVQSGIFGMVFFVILILFALIYTIKCRNQQISSILLCLIINQVFTPSFAGLAIAYIFWPFILYPIVKNRKIIY